MRPTVLVLDDLHCADVATLEVLAYLARRWTASGSRLVAFRPDEVDEVLGEWLQEVRRGPQVIEVAASARCRLAETRTQLTDLLRGDPGRCSATR